jgi:hypothetical protein
MAVIAATHDKTVTTSAPLVTPASVRILATIPLPLLFLPLALPLLLLLLYALLVAGIFPPVVRHAAVIFPHVGSFIGPI